VIVKVNAPLLQDRKPELRSEVMAFRDYLLSSTVSDTLDVWELKGTTACFAWFNRNWYSVS